MFIDLKINLTWTVPDNSVWVKLARIRFCCLQPRTPTDKKNSICPQPKMFAKHGYSL